MINTDEEITNSPESKCLLEYTEERMKKKLGIIMIFTGEVGHGKSFAGLRLLELWYKKYFNEIFPIKHICNSLEEAILIARDTKRIGEGIMIEELSVHAGKRDFATTQNKLWNKFIDICRIKQLVIIGNCPHISFVDSHFQLMCQVWVNCLRVDFKRKIVVAHPLWLQSSPHKSEPYKHKFLNDEEDEIDYCYFKLPSKELYEPYNSLKLQSNEDIFNQIILKLQHDRISQVKKLGQKVLPPRELEAYLLYLKGYLPDESAKKMKLKDASIYQRCVRRAKSKLKQAEYSYFAKEMAKFEEKGQTQDKNNKRKLQVNFIREDINPTTTAEEEVN